jgi:hypothetical protein
MLFDILMTIFTFLSVGSFAAMYVMQLGAPCFWKLINFARNTLHMGPNSINKPKKFSKITGLSINKVQNFISSRLKHLKAPKPKMSISYFYDEIGNK